MRGIVLLFFMTLLLGAEPALAKKIALVLGNQQYTNIGPLKNPENDAWDVAQALRSLKFELVGKNSVGDGGPVLNEDLLGMTEALTRFGREAADADLALVFYAGHGATIDNESYLLPVNAISPLEGDSLSEARLQVLKSNSLPLKNVLKYMERVQGGKIAIIDACRELLNLQQRSLLESVGNEGSFRGGLLPPGGRTNQLLLAFSGASGQLVQDGTGRNSPYTKVLLEEMRQPQHRDIVAFFTDVAAESGQRLSGSSNAQTPVVELRGLRSGRYYLADGGAPPPAPRKADDVAWQDISDSQKVGDFDWFIAEFPGSSYVPLAKRRRDELKLAGPVAGEKWTNSLGMEFVTIPAGKFRMGDDGSSHNDEKPAHEVQILQPFAMMTTEVTVGQFRRFVDANKGYQTDAEKSGGCAVGTGARWDYQADKNWSNPGFTQNDKHPVVCVSWNDVLTMINWLNSGKSEKYRLPSEAEWEYAARASSTTDYSFGNDSSMLCLYGNGADLVAKQQWADWTVVDCNDDYGMTTAPVGHFRANAMGLYDMHGNVWEWVQDCWIDHYNNGPSTDVARESNAGGDCSLRVVRGGSWNHGPDSLRAARRIRNVASTRFGNFGFRLVLVR